MSDELKKDEYLSVKEFSIKAGISTQRVYQLLARPLQDYCKVIDGAKCVHISALERFNEQRISSGLQIDKQDALQDLVNTLYDQIEELKKQKNTLSEQLAVKDSQIEKLSSSLQVAQQQITTLTETISTTQQALVAAQTLHAATIQTTALVDKTIEPEKKQSIFKKLFGKKK